MQVRALRTIKFYPTQLHVFPLEDNLFRAAHEIFCIVCGNNMFSNEKHERVQASSTGKKRQRQKEESNLMCRKREKHSVKAIILCAEGDTRYIS